MLLETNQNSLDGVIAIPIGQLGQIIRDFTIALIHTRHINLRFKFHFRWLYGILWTAVYSEAVDTAIMRCLIKNIRECESGKSKYALQQGPR